MSPRALTTTAAVVVVAAAIAGCSADAGEAPVDAGTGPPAATARPAPAPTAPPRPPARRPREGPAITLPSTVAAVIDGDTIRVRTRGLDDTVRLIGVDTPETRHPTEPVQCHGPEASAALRRMLPAGRAVRLVSDPTQDRRDRFGRLLAYVYRPGRSGPRGSVNHALVAQGHGRAYVYGGVPFRHADAFLAAEAAARAAGRGLWGPPCRGRTDRPAPAPGPGPRTGGAACDPAYAGACIPPPPPDLACDDVPERRFRSVGDDPHGFDGDGDGVACELP